MTDDRGSEGLSNLNPTATVGLMFLARRIGIGAPSEKDRRSASLADPAGQPSRKPCYPPPTASPSTTGYQSATVLRTAVRPLPSLPGTPPAHSSGTQYGVFQPVVLAYSPTGLLVVWSAGGVSLQVRSIWRGSLSSLLRFPR